MDESVVPHRETAGRLQKRCVRLSWPGGTCDDRMALPSSYSVFWMKEASLVVTSRKIRFSRGSNASSTAVVFSRD